MYHTCILGGRGAVDASLTGQLGGAGRMYMAVPSGGSFLVPAGCDPSRAGVRTPVLWLAVCVTVELVLGMLPAAQWQPLFLGEDSVVVRGLWPLENSFAQWAAQGQKQLLSRVSSVEMRFFQHRAGLGFPSALGRVLGPSDCPWSLACLGPGQGLPGSLSPVY